MRGAIVGDVHDKVEELVVIFEVAKLEGEAHVAQVPEYNANNANPAPSFDTTYNDWHTCPCGEDGIYNTKYNRINSTNPCGEYAFLDDTACNLASINVKKFYNIDYRRNRIIWQYFCSNDIGEI